MIDRTRLDVLRETREFAECSAEKLRRIAMFMDEACLPAGTVLAEQGALCHEFVIVVSGLLETCRSGRAGLIGPGDTFGWGAMRDRGVNDASVRALSSTRVLVMSHQQFGAAAALAAAA